MSLLDQGRHKVTVYPAIQAIDDDNNPLMAASPNGFPAYASLQPLSSDEAATIGLETTEAYRLRFSTHIDIGPGSQICWLDTKWSVHGYPKRHTGSARTEHLTYIIKRS